MNARNRDLLVLTKKNAMNASELEHEIEFLNDLLYLVESCSTVCIVNEILDLNRYKIINKVPAVRFYLRESRLKPFVFICNKN